MESGDRKQTLMLANHVLMCRVNVAFFIQNTISAQLVIDNNVLVQKRNFVGGLVNNSTAGGWTTEKLAQSRCNRLPSGSIPKYSKLI